MLKNIIVERILAILSLTKANVTYFHNSGIEVHCRKRGGSQVKTIFHQCLENG